LKYLSLLAIDDAIKQVNLGVGFAQLFLEFWQLITSLSSQGAEFCAGSNTMRQFLKLAAQGFFSIFQFLDPCILLVYLLLHALHTDFVILSIS